MAKAVKLKITGDDEESIEWFLEQIEHLPHVRSRFIDNEHGGYHIYVSVGVVE